MDGFQIIPQRPWYRPPLGVVLLALIVLAGVGAAVWAIVR